MEKTDIAIAVTGAVILVVAIAGSAVYGGTGSAGGTAFTVTFPTMDMPLEPQSATQNGGGEREFTFDVLDANVSRIVFTATGATAVGGPTNPGVALEVTSPAGETFTGEAGTVTVDVAAPPTAFEATAASADAVRLPAPDASATGTWTVKVTVTSQNPLPVPYAVTVEGVVTHWEAKVAPTPPTPTR